MRVLTMTAGTRVFFYVGRCPRVYFSFLRWRWMVAPIRNRTRF